MDQKQAYCCLNCTNLPPCNAAAGNCIPCCADCGDTSACKSIAYIDQYNNFFEGYIATRSYYYEEGDPNVMPFTYQTYYKDSIGATYDSIKNKITILSAVSIAKESNYSSVCNDPEQDGEYWYISSNTYSVDEKITEEESCITSSDGGCPIWKGCPNYPVKYPTVLTNYSFAPKMPDCPQPNNYSTDIRNVSWKNALTLYDNKGEPVKDPWSILGAPSAFNPCAPIRTVGAPCHFFAP
jgi:hypothetical protein